MRAREYRAIQSSGDSAQLAGVAADLEQTRAALDLWQYAVMQLGVDSSAAPFDANTKFPEEVLACATRWLDLLQHCERQTKNKRLFAALTRDIAHCTEWAEEARIALCLRGEIETADVSRRTLLRCAGKP